MRLTRPQWAMHLAQVTARRSTCLRRQVGAILLDRQFRVLSTGYNGVASGMPHCNEPSVIVSEDKDGRYAGLASVSYPHACEGAGAQSGTHLDLCHAIHAEQNALLQCRDVDRIHTCVTTTSPCLTCVKLLMNTGCQEIIFFECYAQTDAEALWRQSSSARVWTKLSW